MHKTMISEIKFWKLKYIFLLGVVIVFFVSCNQTPKKDKGESELPVTSVPDKEIIKVPIDSSTVSKTSTNISLDRLLGKWLRTDGTYTLEIFSSTAHGKLDAGYLNPKPIHVERSEWLITENRLFIRVVLKDVNYPGSTYTLEYIPGSDFLSGIYFQAVEGMNYDVIFTRKK